MLKTKNNIFFLINSKNSILRQWEGGETSPIVPLLRSKDRGSVFLRGPNSSVF